MRKLWGGVGGGWEGKMCKTVSENQAEKRRFKIQSLSPWPNGSLPLWSDQPASSHGMTTKAVHRFGKNAPIAWPRLKPTEQKHITPNNTVCPEKQINISLKVFVDSQHLSSRAWKGRLTNKLSLCFHSDIWMACASACDNRMHGQTRLSHKKPALYRKPVITAIIQLHLICIIQLCDCQAYCKSLLLPTGFPLWHETKANFRKQCPPELTTVTNQY